MKKVIKEGFARSVKMIGQELANIDAHNVLMMICLTILSLQLSYYPYAYFHYISLDPTCKLPIKNK